ncbi:hypothetical protein CTI69_29345 (plasmid) [Klebsiella pneumoniae]|nr:hypothetical protein CTI69_29345 [Klebsiella pneumoniae]
MDAITSLARLGNGGFSDKVLYTTTFPCHNCARHICRCWNNKSCLYRAI